MLDRVEESDSVHCPSCGRDFNDTAEYRRRIYALETALRWLVEEGAVHIWKQDNEMMEVWRETDWEWSLVPNNIARTLKQFTNHQQ